MRKQFRSSLEVALQFAVTIYCVMSAVVQLVRLLTRRQEDSAYAVVSEY